VISGNSRVESLRRTGHFEGSLQLLSKRYKKIRFAHVQERVSTASFVVLILGQSKSNHFGAQGTLKVPCNYEVSATRTFALLMYRSEFRRRVSSF